MPEIASPQMMFEVSDVVRNKAVAVGASGWIERLPGLVGELSEEWEFRPGRQIDGGTESVVVEATMADGRPAVLKILIPRDFESAGNEITVLQLANGEGCPELYRHDQARGALLMERLGRSMFELSIPLQRRHELLCSAVSRLWRPAPDAGLPTGADKAKRLIEGVVSTWEALDFPVSERAIHHAVSCAEHRIAAHDDERSRLVHGDVHQWNALESGAGFRLVDPDGLLAEPEYDLGVIMREDPAELFEEGPWNRVHHLARLTGLDVTAIWEWGVVERVSTGLLCTQIDLQPIGRDMLATAEMVADL